MYRSDNVKRVDVLAGQSQYSSRPAVLLTLGRLPVALELARAMHSAGWRVLVAEPWAWHLCRLSNTVDKSFKLTAPSVDKKAYLNELLRIIEQEKVSLVLPVSEEILYVSELKEQLPASVSIVCVAQKQLLMLHDKYQFMKLAKAHQLSVPKTVLAGGILAGEVLEGEVLEWEVSDGEVLDGEVLDGEVLAGDRCACMEMMKKPFVIKPRFSCSGAGVYFGTPAGEGAVAGSGGVDSLDQGLMTDEYIVQERLRGAACCSFSIVSNGVVQSSVCYRSLLESGSVSVCFEKMRVPDDIAFFIESIVSAVDHSGMIAFDFISDDDGIWHAIECNPRATSGLHFLDHEDVLSEHEDVLSELIGPASGVKSSFAEPPDSGLLDAESSDTDSFDTESSDAESPYAESPDAAASDLASSESGICSDDEPQRRQEFWSSLMQVEGALFKGRFDRAGWRNLFSTRDITWSRADVKPFLLMSVVMLPHLLRAVKVGKPVSQLVMEDLSWRGDVHVGRHSQTRNQPAVNQDEMSE